MKHLDGLLSEAEFDALAAELDAKVTEVRGRKALTVATFAAFRVFCDLDGVAATRADELVAVGGEK